MKVEHKANPVEHFHAQILDHYHAWRRRNGGGIALTFRDGVEFSTFIAECKSELYKQFPELDKKP